MKGTKGRYIGGVSDNAVSQNKRDIPQGHSLATLSRSEGSIAEFTLSATNVPRVT